VYPFLLSSTCTAFAQYGMLFVLDIIIADNALTVVFF
jgi:hypothetical protein